jgi:glycosyltransferase involved in cell wall biosynthesis
MIDICVVTYNRLAYLQNCIWSIIASTEIEYRILVLSDNSTDGTNEWLKSMKFHGKIHEVLINEENIGTAKSLNRVIEFSSSEWFVLTNDDIYFHRGWDKACINITNEFDSCGIVTFINWPKDGVDKPVNEHCYHRQRTGLGAAMMYKESFKKMGGFHIPEGAKMGVFAGNFCVDMYFNKKIKPRKKNYVTIPEYATQMDKHKGLAQAYLYQEYNKRRSEEKSKAKMLKHVK